MSCRPTFSSYDPLLTSGLVMLLLQAVLNAEVMYCIMRQKDDCKLQTGRDVGVRTLPIWHLSGRTDTSDHNPQPRQLISSKDSNRLHTNEI
jgi:hypothetical protein